MGSDVSSFEQPVHLVSVSSFALDRYEVSVGRFRKFVENYETFRLSGAPQNGAGQNSKIPGSGWLSSWSNNLPASRSDLESKLNCFGGNPSYQVGPTWTPAAAGNETKPINCVDWYEAFAFCIWDGGRLATEAEWEYAAAGGSEGRLYPWGPDVPDFSRASFNCLADGSAAGNCSKDDILNVGSKPAGAGKFGHLDLAGNVMEWAFDWTDPAWYGNHSQPGSCSDCANSTPGNPAARSNRGGTYYNAADGMRAANRGSSFPDEHLDWRGVRCARNL
jgi:formylglycine-generating enzyme required for sulfatase activity